MKNIIYEIERTIIILIVNTVLNDLVDWILS